MHYAALDIERDPRTQGFEPGRYDIVFAANVVHATRDVVDEPDAPALPAGAGRPAGAAGDHARARAGWTSSSASPTAGGRSTIGRCGRRARSSTSTPGTVPSPRPASMSRRTSASTRTRSPDSRCSSRAHHCDRPAHADAWLVLADRGGAGERLAEGLRRAGRRAATVFADGRPMPTVLGDVERELGAIHGVLHCRSLDLPAADAATPSASIMHAQAQTCGTLRRIAAGVPVGGTRAPYRPGHRRRAAGQCHGRSDGRGAGSPLGAGPRAVARAAVDRTAADRLQRRADARRTGRRHRRDAERRRRERSRASRIGTLRPPRGTPRHARAGVAQRRSSRRRTDAASRRSSPAADRSTAWRCANGRRAS